jgi:serine/threonine protein kinase/tetratricopeptide (TPR) repeat protein
MPTEPKVSQLRCPNGHHWEVAGESAADGPPTLACPVCGTRVEQTTLGGATTDITSIRDELPPLPRPIAIEPGAGSRTGLSHFEAPSPEGAGLPSVPGYEILKVLGQGGMGVVYLARQTSLDRVVALKMIRSGGLADGEEVVRFRTEAETVARLQHANIVQIYEVGKHENSPYIALEYVSGGSLAHKLADGPLAAQAAARLVEAVARAVHYAHERSIVHRDLKPANILLAAVPSRQPPSPPAGAKASGGGDKQALELGAPKITDFGLAKRLDLDSGQTRTGAIMGSPSYMAPEQAAGRTKEIGPPADIYALGAVLYELVTGRPPFMGASAIETLRQVTHQEPVPPRRLQPAVPRDLETICLKCLNKDIPRRYANAAALADDLHRFVAGEPIQARPSSVWERGAKWVKRRPMAAALIGVSVAAVLALLGVSLGFNVLLREAADRERQKAEESNQQFQLAREAVNELTRVAQERLAAVPQTEQERQAILEVTLKYYQRFLQVKTNDPTLRKEVARAWHYLGSIQELLGRPEQADEAYSQALALQQELAAAFPAAAEFRLDLASTHRSRGWLWQETGRHQDAELAYHQSQEIIEKLAPEAAASADCRRDLARTHYGVGILLSRLGRFDEAERAYRRGLELWQSLTTEFPSDSEYWDDRGAGLLSLGAVLRDVGRPTEARSTFAEALGCKQKVGAAFAGKFPYRLELARIFIHLGDLALQTGQPGDAEEHYRRALAIRAKLADDFPTVPLCQLDLGASHYALGKLLHETGRPGPAKEAYQKAQALWKKISVDFPAQQLDFRQILAGNFDRLGELSVDQGDRLDDAEEAYRQAIRSWQKLAAELPAKVDYRDRAARSRWRLGELLVGRNRIQEAQSELAGALAGWQKLVEEFPQVPEHQANLGNVHDSLGILKRRQGRLDEAEEEHRRALALREKLNAKHPNVPLYRAGLVHTLHSLGQVLQDASKLSQAENAFQEAFDLCDRLTADFPDVLVYRANLSSVANGYALLFKATNRTVEAEKFYGLALDHAGRLAAAAPLVPRYRQQLGHVYFNQGNSAIDDGHYHLAERRLVKARELFDDLRKKFPDEPAYRFDRAAACNSLGNTYRPTGRWAEAEKSWQEALELYQGLVQEFPQHQDYVFELAMAQTNLGLLLVDLKRLREAAKRFQETRGPLEKLAGKFPQVEKYHEILATALFGSASASADGEAKRYLTEAIEHMQVARQLNERQPRYRTRLLAYCRRLCETLARLGEHRDLASAVAQRHQLDPENLEEVYRAAGFLALCVAFAEKDASLSADERKACKRQYGEQALDYVRQARSNKTDSGSADAARWRREFQQGLRESPLFAPVRNEEVIQKLLRELEVNGESSGASANTSID